MSSAPITDRLASVLGFPWELADYLRFVEAQARAGKARNDLFSEEVPRFEPRPEDLLVARGHLKVVPQGRAILLTSAEGLKLQLPEVSAAEVSRLLQAMDGTRRAAELAWQSTDLERVLRATFGVVVFAPAAVEELERGVAGTEVTRFPSSPYAIQRPYWENMLAVQQALEGRLATALSGTDQALALLRELHVLSTMGASLQSFYKPSSPVSDGGVMPGALWNVPSRTLSTTSGTLFLSGPRVNAGAPAGERYHRMLYASVGDEQASEPERVLSDEDGLEWGRLLMARATHDQQFAPWFCPPRPLGNEHFARLFTELREALGAAERGDEAATVRHLARFHWRFVHLHPFRCANQCIAMSLVNHVLRRALNAGMAHLILDQLSVRLRVDAYQRLFERAVGRYVLKDTEPAARYAFYREQKRLAFMAMQRVAEAPGEGEAQALLVAHPEEARAALLA